MKWSIVGCGYVGTELVESLGHHHVVTVTKRDASSFKTSVNKAINFCAPSLPTAWVADSTVVFSIPATEHSPAWEREFVKAAASYGARRLIYLSSSTMYPPANGGWVDETTPPRLDHERGRKRFDAEQAFLNAAEEFATEACSLRLVGIYGPGRGVVARMKAGKYRLVGDGTNYVNRIHVADIVSAIRLVADAPQLPSRVYNVADDNPSPSIEFAKAVSRQLSLPMPPVFKAEEVTPRIARMLTSNRRVSNKLIKKELGFSPRYPSYEDALEELIQRPNSRVL